MEHLPTTEEDGKLHLVSSFQEFTRVTYFDAQIMRVGFRSEPDFLQRHGVEMMFLMCISNLPFLLVEPFAVVHNSTNGGIAVGGDLNEVKARLAGPVEGVPQVHYSRLTI